MAKFSAKNAVVLIGGYNFSSYATAYQTNESVNPVEVTGFGDGCQNFITGIKSVSITADMLWDSSANSVHAALKTLPNNSHVTIIPEGYTLGIRDISLAFTQGNYGAKGDPTSAVQVGTLNFNSYGANSSIGSGWALQHATITSTTSNTGFDVNGGAVTAACAGTLHIWTPCATDTYSVIIEHSTALGSGYATLITFTSNGSARTSERITVASGTINQYLRVTATRTGAASNPFGFTVHFEKIS